MSKERAVKNESKDERFKRIATRRVQRILNDLRLLGNCSNTGTYYYKEDDINKIFGAISNEVKRVRMLFSNTESKRRFSLE
ncbi:MAG: hypothetical protein QXO75_10335 [Nitrososphaerota archaeon]